jgi:hypothetical protein
MSGKPDPNLGAFGIGSPRGQVELQLGSPVASVTDANGMRTDTYEYELGNEPSAGRAVGHAVLDVLTLGLWEVAGTPIEAFQGQTRRLTITYDRQDRVLAFNNPSVALNPAGTPPRLGGDPLASGAMQCAEPELRTVCKTYPVRTDLYRTYCEDRSVVDTNFAASSGVLRQVQRPNEQAAPGTYQAERCQVIPAT